MVEPEANNRITDETGRAWFSDLKHAAGLVFCFPLPWPPPGPTGPAEAADATRALPLVGLCLGIAAAILYAVAFRLGLAAWPSAFIAVLALVAATCARAEVAAADLADRLASGADAPEGRSLGYHGVFVLIFATLLKVAVVAALAEPNHAGAGLAAAVAASWAAVPVLMVNLSPVSDAKAGVWARRPSAERMWTAAALGAAFVLLFLGPLGGIVALILALAAGAGVVLVARRKWGGYSSEVLAAGRLAVALAVLLGTLVTT